MRRYFSKDVLPKEGEIKGSIKQWSYPIPSMSDLQPLFDHVGDARIVMLGEATHGTHEYYTWRTYITQRLINEKGFNFIAVEGDWPDCYRLNRFIKGLESKAKNAIDVLHAFNRWPTWMWANWEIIVLANWLKKYNKTRDVGKKIGFYGLDVYSLWESLDSIVEYLRKVDPGALKVAEEAFRCFEPYRGSEGTGYAQAAKLVPELCETEVVQLLKEIQNKITSYDGDPENVFSTEQNAIITVNAEKYYREMINGGSHSWNLRDRHMTDTLDRLLDFHGPDAKAIVWEHNTHIGDARATDMISEGIYNIGELARVKYGQEDVVLVGFGSYAGTVMASRRWGQEMEPMTMPEARKGSLESLIHEAGGINRLLIMDDFTSNDAFMENHLDHRAIGVVYNPEFEKYSNYVPTILPLRYDAFIYLDKTRALFPLHLKPDGSQIPETYPFGF